jgi:hypothetical protein
VPASSEGQEPLLFHWFFAGFLPENGAFSSGFKGDKKTRK